MHNCVINLKILTKQNYGKYKSQKLDEDVEPCTAKYSWRKLSEAGPTPSEKPLQGGGREGGRPCSLPWGGRTPKAKSNPQNACACACTPTHLSMPHVTPPECMCICLPTPAHLSTPHVILQSACALACPSQHSCECTSHVGAHPPHTLTNSQAHTSHTHVHPPAPHGAPIQKCTNGQ